MTARRNLQLLKLLTTDFGAALLAWIAFFGVRRFLLREVTEGVPFKPDELFSLGLAAIAIGLFWLLLYALFGHYRGIFRKSRVRELIALAQVSAMGCVIVFFALLLDDRGVQNYHAYYKTVTAYFLLHFLCSTIMRVIVVTGIQRLVRERYIAFNTLIVGANARAAEVYHELENYNRHLGLRILGYVPVFDPPDPRLPRELRNLGFYASLPNLVREYRIEEVVIAIEPSEHKLIEEILGLLDEVHVRVSILPDLYQILLGSVKVSHLFGTPLIEIKQDLLPVWQAVTKRVLDVVASAKRSILISSSRIRSALTMRRRSRVWRMAS